MICGIASLFLFFLLVHQLYPTLMTRLVATALAAFALAGLCRDDNTDGEYKDSMLFFWGGVCGFEVSWKEAISATGEPLINAKRTSGKDQLSRCSLIALGVEHLSYKHMDSFKFMQNAPTYQSCLRCFRVLVLQHSRKVNPQK